MRGDCLKNHEAEELYGENGVPPVITVVHHSKMRPDSARDAEGDTAPLRGKDFTSSTLETSDGHPVVQDAATTWASCRLLIRAWLCISVIAIISSWWLGGLVGGASGVMGIVASIRYLRFQEEGARSEDVPRTIMWLSGVSSICAAFIAGGAFLLCIIALAADVGDDPEDKTWRVVMLATCPPVFAVYTTQCVLAALITARMMKVANQAAVAAQVQQVLGVA